MTLDSPVGRPFEQEQPKAVDSKPENPSGKLTTPGLPTMGKTKPHITPKVSKISVDDPSLKLMVAEGKAKHQSFSAIHNATGGSMLDEELNEACREIAVSAIASFKSKSDPNRM